jgi:TRAP-type C4-dicarboxylate transport system permease small subunit
MVQDKKPEYLKRAYRPLEFLLAANVIVIFVLVILEVFSRYIFHVSIEWVAEVTQTLLVWLTFVGAAVALLSGDHMVINILLNKSSTGLRKAWELIGDLAILSFVVPGLIGGYNLVLRTWDMTTTTLQIPAGIMYLAFPLGCILMLPIILRDIISKFTRE